MNDKTRLVEMEVAACFLALAIAAFILMAGHLLWLRLVGK
jgi:hypothetical protein